MLLTDREKPLAKIVPIQLSERPETAGKRLVALLLGAYSSTQHEPTYTSWLNQKDLARKLKRYIRHYNRAPKPIKWTYRDPSHRITADTTSLITGH